MGIRRSAKVIKMSDVFAGMSNEPYWWNDVPRQNVADSGVPGHVDVLIVGAGYTGLNAARILARAGKSVLICEQGFLGCGASTRNGGMLGPSFHKLGVKGLQAHYGKARTHNILRESIGFVDFMRDLLEAENIDCDFRRVGRFRCASRPAHYEEMARAVDAQKVATGIEAEMLPAARVREEIGSDRFFGGVRYKIDAAVHPAKYHDGLVRIVQEAGCNISTQTTVTSIAKQADGFEITTSKGIVKSGQVAVCTNGYTSKVTPWLNRRIMPVRSAIIATEKLPSELIDELMPTRRCYGDSRRIMAYYRTSPDDRRILFGGRATSRDDAEKNAKLLRQSMLEVFPQLARHRITHSWSGLVAYAFDHVPHLGQHDGLFYAMGYCGSGESRASFFGTKMAYKMLGEDEKGATAFDDLPFNSRPFYNGKPWFLPTIIRWHRFVDWLGI